MERTRHAHAFTTTLILSFVCLIALGTSASATQHLLQPGDSWDVIDERLRPGDEILLLPGEHEPGVLTRAQGTGEQPITIRSLDPSQEATINATRYGIRLQAPKHVIIEKIRITGATINGIMAAGDDINGDSTSSEWSGALTIRDIRVSQTGPEGKRDAIACEGLRKVRITRCTIDGWAGSGIRLTTCMDVDVSECKLEALDGHSQTAGITVQSGCEDIRISDCRIATNGGVGVLIGGTPALTDFHPSLTAETTHHSSFDATNVSVRRTYIVGASPVFHIAHADGCRLSNNTVVDPRGTVVQIAIEHIDPRMGTINELAIYANMVVWTDGMIDALLKLPPQVAPAEVDIQENLWWSDGAIETRNALVAALTIKPTFPQILDLDPGLDEFGLPQVADAELFGAGAP